MKKYYISVALISFCILSIGIAGAVIPSAKPSPHEGNTSNLKGSPGERASFGQGCDGRTDIPHESRHVPSTVNVEAMTECPNQEVFITTTISRHGWWIFPDTKSVSGQGYQKVDVNVALPCKWKTGQPPILYVVKSFHRDSEGAKALTGRSEEI